MATLATLQNGLRVVFVPCEAESIAFGLFVKSGSRHEPEKFGGISHFIEHMLFKGTPTRNPLQITQAIEGRGGMFNAWTSEESTAYFAHLPNEYLGEAIDILSDMYLHASIPDEEFLRERGVVLEEIKMYADEPDSVAMENLQRALFPSNRLGAPVAGSAATLLPLKPKDLRAYIKSHYRPDNTVAVLVGAFSPEEAKPLLEKALGRHRPVRAALKRAEPVDFGAVNPFVSVQKDIQQTQIALGYRTFGVSDPRAYTASVLDAIMGRGMSSRLFQEVREKRGLSYDISSHQQFFSDAGMWTITAGTDPAKADKAIETIDRELKKVVTRRVSKDELERTKEFLVGNFRLSHEKVQSKLFFYGSTMLSYGRLMEPEEQVEGIHCVTVADVQSVAQAILRPENRALSRVDPRTV